MSLLASTALILVLAPPASVAKGTFSFVKKSSNIDAHFTVADAFAWEQPSQDDPETKVIRVWLSEKPLDHTALVSAADLRAELFRQSGKERLLELEFGGDGTWLNTAWKLPATMCGLCGEDEAYRKASSVKVGNGTVRASLKVNPSDYTDSLSAPAIDLTLDIKVERRLTTAAAPPF